MAAQLDGEVDWDAHSAAAQAARKAFAFGSDGAEMEVAYLNGAFMSPTLQAATEACKAGLEVQRCPWNLTYPAGFRNPVEEARELFSRVVEAPMRNIALIPSVAYAVTLASQHLANVLGPGDEILGLGNQYVSNVLGWKRVAEERQAALRLVPEPADGDWTRAVLAALGGPDAAKIKMVVVPACSHWCDGAVLDLAQVAPKVRALGARLFVDGTQSIGVVPFSISEIQPDYLAVAAYKWLFCPYGLTFLYVADEHCVHEPLEMHGMARANGGFCPDGTYDAEWLCNDRENDYMDGARRYDMGETSNFVTLAMASAALRQVIDWQATDAVRRHTRPLLAYLCDEAAALGLGVPPLHLRSPHIVGLRVPNASPQELTRLVGLLKENRVLASLRGPSVRVSPHIWATKADVDRLLGVLRTFVAGRP